MLVDRPQVEVTSRRELRRWLAHRHATSPGIWLVRWKRHVADRHVTYEAVVEEALCFGWVDSQPRALDARRSMLLLTPRRPASRWSAANKARIERLTADGRMAPAGLAAVATARANGAWGALDQVDALAEPEDLAAALDRRAAARRHWDGFPPSTRRAILEWILTARRSETRARRVAVTVEEAAAGRRAHQWRRPPP
ncbi:MAG TPA: YdeI/OmpD-associated family protein [Acidimicrobiales bacterium]|nr:YdeI/OmpD-associated family protein [Acidimicrobiales bacterium]